MVSHKTVNLILASLGVLLSAYSLYVEWRLEQNEPGAEDQYKPLCDISARASCSRVFGSKYGRGMGLLPTDNPLNLPNGVYGLCGYIILIVLGYVPSLHKLLLVSTVAIVGVSVYLAYILFAVLYDFCAVCTALYIVNILLLVNAVWNSCCGLKKSERVKKD